MAVVATRPRLTWRGFSVVQSVLTGGTLAAHNLGVVGFQPTLAQLGVHGDYTIRRVRWSIGLFSSLVEAIDDVRMFTWGMTVVTADAFATGGGALPNPQDDPADWFGYGTIPYAEVPVTDDKVHRFLELDGRSMRRINENSQVPALILFIQAGQTVNYVLAGRMLVSHGRG